MRHLLLSVLVLSACYHDGPTPAAPPPPAPVAWEAQSGAFIGKLADVLDAAAGDCVKVTSGLAALAPDAKALAKTLADAKKKFHDYKPDAALQARVEKHGNVLDRCENEKTPGFGEAVNATLLTVEPFEPDMTGVDIGGVFAPK